MVHRVSKLILSTGLQLMAFALTVGYLIWMLSAGQGAAFQDHEKIFKQRDFNAKDPVKITNLATANKPLRLNQGFDARSEWLRSMQLQLQNVSQKDIIYIELQFNFPETKSSGNEMSYRVELGNM